jgi:hypothetical protein
MTNLQNTIFARCAQETFLGQQSVYATNEGALMSLEGSRGAQRKRKINWASLMVF